MRKIIVGISAPRKSRSRQVINTIAKELDLAHINMKQPALDMVASLSGLHPTELGAISDDAVLKNKTVYGLGMNVVDLEASISRYLLQIKSDFFITRAQAELNHLNQMNTEFGETNTLFNGQVISGVSTAMEAQWIRNLGGVMLHVMDYSFENLGEYHGLEEKAGDIILVTNSAVTVNKVSLTTQLAAIRKFFDK